MAKSSEGKKPRIRRSAPTVRERVEAEKVKAETVKPQRSRHIAAKAISPLRKLGRSDNIAVKAAKKPFTFIKKILRWIVPRYLVNSWRELRQVYWPSRRETWRLTLAVFVFSVIFGALVAGVDKGLDEIFKKVILK